MFSFFKKESRKLSETPKITPRQILDSEATDLWLELNGLRDKKYSGEDMTDTEVRQMNLLNKKLDELADLGKIPKTDGSSFGRDLYDSGAGFDRKVLH